MVMNLKQKTRSALKYALGSAALNFTISLFGMVLLVRYLELSDYGVYAIIAALPAMIHLFSSLGYHHWITRFVPMMDNVQEVAHRVLSILIRRLSTRKTKVAADAKPDGSP